MTLPVPALTLAAVLLTGGTAVVMAPDPAPGATAAVSPALAAGPGTRGPERPLVWPLPVDRGRARGPLAAPAATPTAANWGPPLAGPLRVVRGFDPPPSPWLPGHRGVDLAASPGDAVLAAGAGTVTFAGPLAGRGVVTVTHGVLRTTYEPVSAVVTVGQRVRLGDRIGVLSTGSAHCGGLPPCLHWGLRRGTTYLDPLLLLGLSHPVLLPIPAG